VPTYPYYLANKPQAPNVDLEVTDKYSGEIVARVAVADARAIDTAIAAAEAAQMPLRNARVSPPGGVAALCRAF
jgi:acyl-CoA reductase-like NAD-dependent aldehyde dehydrogenase